MYAPLEEPHTVQMVCHWKGKKIDNVEVKIIAFVTKPGWKFTSTVYHECEIKAVCQVIHFVSFLNSQLEWIYLFEIIQQLLVIKSNRIISVSIAQIEWPVKSLIICLQIHSHMSKRKVKGLSSSFQQSWTSTLKIGNQSMHVDVQFVWKVKTIRINKYKLIRNLLTWLGLFISVEGLYGLYQ